MLDAVLRYILERRAEEYYWSKLDIQTTVVISE